MKFINLHKTIENISNNLSNPRIREMFIKCFFNTIDTTCKFQDDGSVFVITGDIPAMWLRDSSAQVMQYLNFVEDPEVKDLVKGVLKKQFEMILIDGYANAFMENESSISEWDGQVETNYLPKIVWERKFELDSLVYPLFLLCKYYEKTNDTSVFNDLFYKTFDRVIKIFKTEQNHETESNYYFRFLTREGQYIHKPNRTSIPHDKGLIWSGFRPSDDICTYHYHIPDNMFAVSILFKFSKIFKLVLFDSNRESICNELVKEINDGINKYGIIETEEFGKVYASEVDCLGNYSLNDDANIPSLLSVPYLEYPFMDKEIYQNTRNYILSKNNKFYYEGELLKGIGSPHTPSNRVWTLSLAMQGLTSDNNDEIQMCFNMLTNSDANTGYMHESVDTNDCSIYSRPWFAWANSLFSEFIIQKIINK